MNIYDYIRLAITGFMAASQYTKTTADDKAAEELMAYLDEREKVRGSEVMHLQLESLRTKKLWKWPPPPEVVTGISE